MSQHIAVLFHLLMWESHPMCYRMRTLFVPTDSHDYQWLQGLKAKLVKWLVIFNRYISHLIFVVLLSFRLYFLPQVTITSYMTSFATMPADNTVVRTICPFMSLFTTLRAISLEIRAPKERKLFPGNGCLTLSVRHASNNPWGRTILQKWIILKYKQCTTK